jgi:hypothetical protein
VSEDVERTDSLRSFASLRMTGGTFEYEGWGGRDATRNQDCRSDRDKHLCWRTASEGGPYKVYEPWKSAQSRRYKPRGKPASEAGRYKTRQKRKFIRTDSRLAKGGKEAI